MLTMWVTEDEHRRLLERCDGKQLAAWMRQTCLAEKPARAGKLPSISPALLRQLAGMGNNLNQIARQVNAGGGSGHDRVQVVAALMAIDAGLERLGDLRRLRGDRDKKSVPHCIVHACMNGLFFLTTELHRSFSSYITFTSLIHHFYIIPSAHTSLSSSVPFVHHPLPERADSGFSGCAGNASRPRNKLRPRSPFSDGKNAGNRTYPG